MNLTRINHISIYLSFIIIGIFLLVYLGDFILDFDSYVLLYPLGITFLIWFATRKNGCGSCNQIS